MCSVLLSVTLFLFGLAFQSGNAEPECPPHPDNLLIYFDIEQISLMQLQHDFTGLFQSPLMCRTGKDKDCEDQRCCGTEEGCCLTDSTSQYGKCGCRDKGQSKCSYPAPLAVLGKPDCSPESKTRAVTCLRELRMEPEYIVGRNSTGQAVKEAKTKRELKRTQRMRINLDIHSECPVSYRHGAEAKNIFLQQFTVKQLGENLSKNMIDNLFEWVTERISKGQSYGLPE